MARSFWFAGTTPQTVRPKQSVKRTRASLSGPDPGEERPPPAEATPVTFPQQPKCDSSAWTAESPPPDFQSLFARILRPTDISQHHLDALNIKILPTCSIDELLPLAPDGSSYIPTLPSVSDTFGSNDSDAIAARRRKDLSERVTELRVENDVAFQTLTRSLPPGTKPPRLAYMRKFWEGLESMSQFWDCSLDDYYERPEPDEHDSQVAKRQRLDVEMPDVSSSNAGLLNAAISNTSDSTGLMNERKQPGTRHESDSADDLDENPMSTARGSSSEHAGSAAAPTTPTVMRYKGRRTGTGRSMPDQFRADTVKAFVEGAVWPFRTSLSPPRMMPVVQFDKLNLPVRQTAAVYRTPNDRTKSRQGWIEGPIMGIQVRSETDFHNETGAAADHKDRLDCMREIGGLLQLAQQRRREGQTESKPGEGKWWTTKKRWGGGPGGEVQNEEGNSDDIEGMEEVLEGEQTGNAKDKAARKNRSKKTQESLWRELRCGRGYWDPKTDYTAIGTDPASEYDTVFLVSSLNHHVSLIKMVIHGAYIDYLTDGQMVDSFPKDEAWSTPTLQRSPWFDLLDMDERLQALRGLWGIMTFLMR